MPTFIDESGDTGPIDAGGKPYFRLAAVWFPSHADADVLRDSVRALRVEMGLGFGYEFKYSRTHNRDPVRRRFFETALSCPFCFAVSSIDKTDDYWRVAEGREMHWACATELAARLRHTYITEEARRGTFLKDEVVVDENKDGEFLAVIKRQFRALRSAIRPDSPLIGKVAFRRSAPDETVQLADMVCGAFGDENQSLYELIRGRGL